MAINRGDAMKKIYTLLFMLLLSTPITADTRNISDVDEITEEETAQIENVGKKIRNMRNAARNYERETADLLEEGKTSCLSGKQITAIIGGIATILVTAFKLASMLKK